MDTFFIELADSGIRLVDISPWYMLLMIYFGISFMGFLVYGVFWAFNKFFKNF